MVKKAKEENTNHTGAGGTNVNYQKVKERKTLTGKWNIWIFVGAVVALIIFLGIIL